MLVNTLINSNKWDLFVKLFFLVQSSPQSAWGREAVPRFKIWKLSEGQKDWWTNRGEPYFCCSGEILFFFFFFLSVLLTCKLKLIPLSLWIHQVRNAFAQLARAEEEVTKLTLAHETSQAEWRSRKEFLEHELNEAVKHRVDNFN